MELDEDAAVPYNPTDEEQSEAGGTQAALVEAERQLSRRQGVHGMGITQTPNGLDAIVVYVQDEQTLSQLPSEVSGVPVVGEVTGRIRAF